MSEVIRGYFRKQDLEDVIRGSWGLADAQKEYDDDQPVAILPISEGKVGGFEEWMVEWMRTGNVGCVPEGCFPAGLKIATAISALFEEQT